jgi:hypothetical protein
VGHATCIGSFGLFFTLFCIFVRFLPMTIAIAEVKSVMPQADPHYHPKGTPRPRHGKEHH